MHPEELTSNKTRAKIAERISFYAAFLVIPYTTTRVDLFTNMLMSAFPFVVCVVQCAYFR